MASQTDLEQVWLVVSPHNPLKNRKSLAKDYDRLHLVHLAIQDNPLLSACDIEFKLPKPSYTVDTLAYLKEKYSDKEFVLIMGGDNLASLEKWKNYEFLVNNYEIYVYDRPGSEISKWKSAEFPGIHFFDAPQMHISASYIRNCLKNGYSIEYLVNKPVLDYLEKNSIYR